jgi:hypothetical protein
VISAVFLHFYAAALLLAAPIAVRSRFRQRFLAPTPAGRMVGDPSVVAAAMRRTLFLLPFRFTCLERASALHRLFHRQGVPSHLRIGVRHTAAGIAAHAWVEFPAGHPWLDEESPQYHPLESPMKPGG